VKAFPLYIAAMSLAAYGQQAVIYEGARLGIQGF
jgi:hypothetical protein